MNKTHENDQFYGSTGSTVPGRDWCQCSGACMCGRTVAARVQTTKQPWSVAKGKWLPMGPNFGPHIYPQLQSPVPDLLSQALQKNYFVCSSIPPSFNIGKSGRGRVWKWAMGELSVACDSMSDGCVFWRNWYCGQKLPFWVFKHWNRITPKFWVAKECSNKLVGTQFLSG